MNLLRSREKISEKKCDSIFSKVRLKKSWENSKEKIGSRQVDILKFELSNLSKRYFSISSFMHGMYTFKTHTLKNTHFECTYY
jgi:hypothetical protein